MSLEFASALRQNHALEHATIALLVKRLGMGTRLIGQATPGGFVIYGDIPTQAVEEAVSEGLSRLQRGEAELAVSSMCGTNLVVAGLLAGISVLAVVGSKNRLRRLPHAVLAAVSAVVAAQPLGRLAQRHITTSADLSRVRMARVTHRGRGRRTLHKIEIIR
jgi:hypothetical protein